MDVRIGLSLLLLLAYANCGAWSKSPKDSPTARHHRHHRQVQRPSGALSEFLVPPPAPAHLRGGSRGPPPPHQAKGNQPPPVPPPPPQKQHTRNGRYVNQQGGGNNNNGPGYFSKLMTWLNPFNGDSTGKDSHSQAASNYPKQTAQYAPHMPYTGVSDQYEAPPHSANLQNSYSNLAGWMSGKSCNPCNQVPWIPVFRDNVQNNHGQYASSAPNNAYLAPPPPHEVKPPDYSHSNPVGPPPGNQNHYPIPNPHLYPGSVPPLYKAKPFNDPPTGYSAPNVNQPPSNIDHQPAPSFDHPPKSNFNQPPSNFDHPPQTNFNQPPPNFDHPPQSNFNQPPPNFDHPPQSNFNQPPPNFNQHPPPSFNNGPPTNYDHPPSNFGDSSPQNHDHQPPPNYNNQQSIELDHPPTNFDQQNFEDHPPPNFDHQPTSNYDQQKSQNYDYHSSSDFDSGPPSNYEEHPPPNFEQHHQSSQIVDVVKEAPLHLDNPESNQEPDHAESRPVLVNSASEEDVPNHLQKAATPTQSIVHFQRSPLIDLSNIGDTSTTAKPEIITILPLKVNRETTTPPAATVIDYIVSGPDESLSFSSSEEERELRLTPPSVTTTTTLRTTTMKQDQRQQESLIETLVQSYEFYKKRNDTRGDGVLGGRLFMNDTGDDYSASREVVLPNKVDNGKKNKQIIQIIIPYTSQYTPSPFHPTHSINGHARHPYKITAPTTTSTTTEEPIDEHVEDNVVIQESRRVSVTRDAPEATRLRNNRTDSQPSRNSIDVHRLQKNIDNWTIQEYSKSATSVTNSPNSTYPRWLSSKQIPDEYLLSTTEVDESSEYYDYSNETDVHRGTNTTEEPTTTMESVTKVNIINATYPKKPDHSTRQDERVYVVTPVPNPNSLEDLSSSEKEQTRSRTRKGKNQKDSVSVERAYQVLPQAVNNLAVLSSAPDSAAPALWGIMEHEEFAASVDQPRWRSESDVLPDPASTPILYAGHSKVSRAR